MGTVKVSITLQEEHVREAKRRAGTGGLSAYIDDMLRRQLQHERLGRLLDELDQEFPSTEEEQEAARKRTDAQWPTW